MKNIKPFWDDEFKKLDYRKEIFNDEYAIDEWRENGYDNDVEKFSGKMANHNDPLPSWHNKILEWIDNEFELKDVGCCYYRMDTNDIIPNHSDAYNVYTKKFNCKTKNLKSKLNKKQTEILVSDFIKKIDIVIIKPPIIVLADGTSFIPKIGNQTQKIPPKTSVKDNKVRSAAGKFLEPIE